MEFSSLYPVFPFNTEPYQVQDDEPCTGQALPGRGGPRPYGLLRHYRTGRGPKQAKGPFWLIRRLLRLR